MASANKSPRTKDDTTTSKTDSAYPDFNTPLNVMKAPQEPGPETWNEVSERQDGGGSIDPMGYLKGLQDGKGKKG